MAALRAGGVKVCLTTGFTDEVQRAIIEHLGWEEVTDFFIAPSETSAAARTPTWSCPPGFGRRRRRTRGCGRRRHGQRPVERVPGGGLGRGWRAHGRPRPGRAEKSTAHPYPGLHRRFPGRRPQLKCQRSPRRVSASGWTPTVPRIAPVTMPGTPSPPRSRRCRRDRADGQIEQLELHGHHYRQLDEREVDIVLPRQRVHLFRTEPGAGLAGP